MYINYYALNNNTVKNKYTLFLINKTFYLIIGVFYFICINLCTAYWLIRIAAGEKWKIAFKTRYNLYKWCIILIKLINTPVII